MIYQLYQAQADALAPIRALAQTGSGILRQFDFGALTPPLMRHAAAFFDMISDSSLTHHRPPFGIETVQIGNAQVTVTEEVADDTPFGTLLRFRKDTAVRQPRVLLVAPMSGHFATLLRGTVRTMLPEHDLYITDWKNARDTGLEHGAVRRGRVRRARDPLPGGHGARQPRGRGVPAGGGGAGGGRGDGGVAQPRPAPQHDADGRADRHAHQADPGQSDGDGKVDRVVRAAT